MDKAYKAVEDLIARNARHRKGFRLQEVSNDFVIEQAVSELRELSDSPSDPLELADALGCLIHYAVKHGWTLKELEQLMLRKFKERFDTPKNQENANG